jgi:hypothetical protein
VYRLGWIGRVRACAVSLRHTVTRSKIFCADDSLLNLSIDAVDRKLDAEATIALTSFLGKLRSSNAVAAHCSILFCSVLFCSVMLSFVIPFVAFLKHPSFMPVELFDSMLLKLRPLPIKPLRRILVSVKSVKITQ